MMHRIQGRFALAAAALALALAGGSLGVRAAGHVVLTAEQVERLQRVIEKQGTHIQVPPPVAGALRLEPAQISPSVHQGTYQDEAGVKHGFAALNDGTGYFLFRRKDRNQITAFRTDREFKLLGATQNFQDTRFIAMVPAAAQDALDAEMAGWSHVLSPRGPSMTPLLKPPAAAAPSPAAPAPATGK